VKNGDLCVNIRLPQNLAARIGAAAESRRLFRSAFLAQSAKNPAPGLSAD
jgi:hypothetical protein